jgi:hypothetical protein
MGNIKEDLMKRLAFVLILAMITVISCAKEKDKKAKNVISANALSTVTGYYSQSNPQQPLTVEGVPYAVSPQTNPQIINQALQQAQMNRVQPLLINGQPRYRATMTVIRYNQYGVQSGQYNQQYQQPVQQQPLSNVLTVSQISFY